jgi:hypothetical protein
MDKQRVRGQAAVDRGNADRQRQEAQEPKERKHELGSSPVNSARCRNALAAHEPDAIDER